MTWSMQSSLTSDIGNLDNVTSSPPRTPPWNDRLCCNPPLMAEAAKAVTSVFRNTSCSNTTSYSMYELCADQVWTT
jgi:hypothetical protein